MAEPILELQNVSSSYGNIKALKDISLKVFPGEIVTIIGANGAGKSTTLMAICGIVPINKGDIFYNGKSIRGIAAEKLPVLGLCQIPEGRRIFPRLTVHENLELGAFFRKDRSEIEKDMENVISL
ncbi:MAG: ATP-binding cassette domain-containing protein, partial [Desulfobacterales bacterium]|nr:ATP-binding cassette domain-containing protein [Desulfobacterales bacterium]MDX2509447.1 ATP-binding cassette domain-containing protein [Desulfobacterales bacterium]